MEQIPLNHEASAGDTHKQATASLPTEVVQCLENARFLHLATCVDNVPHVSLMNYTYLPAGLPSSADAAAAAAGAGAAAPTPVIVMTSNPASRKTHNILQNPSVSLLVHDWVSHRPLTRRLSSSSEEGAGGGGGAPAIDSAAQASPLAALLFNLNTAAVSSISATINGTARLVAQGSAEEAYYRQQHLAHNTFDADPVGPDELRIHRQIANGAAAHNTAPSAAAAPPSRFVDEEVRVIVVAIRDVRISDWKGHVRDWVLAPGATTSQAPVANGV